MLQRGSDGWGTLVLAFAWPDKCQAGECCLHLADKVQINSTCINLTAPHTPLPSYCSVREVGEFYLRPQWFCLDQVLFVSDPSPCCLTSEELELLRQHVNVSDRTQHIPSDGVSLQALQKMHHFMHCLCMECISRVNIRVWNVDWGLAEGYYCCCLSDLT